MPEPKLIIDLPMADPGIEQTFNAALNLHRSGRLSDAEPLYRQVLDHQPNHPDSLHLLGYLRFQAGDSPAAVELINRAIVLRPEFAVYHNNLGIVLEKSGRMDAASEAYRTALRLDPKYAEAHSNLGNVLQALGLMDEAVDSYYSALRHNSAYFPAHFNLGNLFKEVGRIEDAIACYRRAVDLEPSRPAIHSNLLLALHYASNWPASALADEHRRWNERHAAPLKPLFRPHANVRDEERRLRIGYVSPDFYNHAVARFLLPLLINHNRAQFEILAYSNVQAPDRMSARIKSHVDGWRDIAQLDDSELADLVRTDQIDILVDLAGHTANGRLMAFARKPAPVQAYYLAYCSTTGLAAMDYRLTDPNLDPESMDLTNPYVEKSVHLPRTYWCYSAPDDQFQAGPFPAGETGVITFGCLNNSCKVTRDTLRVWGRLLCAVPGSRLLLFARTSYQRRQVQEALQSSGVETARLHFVGSQSYSDYMATYRRIDIALDPIPFTGGTTTCDALWMGVPVVSLAGQTAVSRGGLSLLSNVGCPGLVAHTENEYVRIAAELSENRLRLAELRRSLRARLMASPVMDGIGFTRDFEAALRHMWQDWCRCAPGT